MSRLLRLQSRWKFVLPTAYEKMSDDGLFDPGSSNHLHLHDARWLTPGQIADFEFAEWVMHGLVPFAKQADGSIWAWWPSHAAPAGIPVVRSWRDSNRGEIYSSNFESFVYRQLAEELGDLQAVVEAETGHDEVRSLLRKKIGSVAPHLPAVWIDTLSPVIRKNVLDSAEGFAHLLSQSELRSLLRSAMPDIRVNLNFIQHWEDVRPLGRSGLFKAVTLFGRELSANVISGVLKKFGAVSGSTLVSIDRFHGALIFPTQCVAVSHYNPQKLAVVGVVSPPMVMIDAPAEGVETLLAILRRLLPFEPAIATCRGVEPLKKLLASEDPWGDLRWA